MKLDRVWAMPSAETFTVKPIRALIERHMGDGDFLKSLPAGSVDGVLFDPPFSPRQVKEAYQGFGPADTTRRFYSSRKREAARVIKTGGIAIVCGWNSLGLGKKNGMELEEILMVNHGDQNDTIVTVGRKVASVLDFEGALSLSSQARQSEAT